ncbi:hypothetical protein Y032_0103g3551 [Ancylostoma ceylanicum]|uniref:Uncharacterized protein n=1 Tax=Ancylostoma ceylanicum TaxID=53326 RepID=A0A016TH07_9BILA|nr:hypothetical protein Y032_0103g3551 [Ancylostoma ceylanicum]
MRIIVRGKEAWPGESDWSVCGARYAYLLQLERRQSRIVYLCLAPFEQVGVREPECANQSRLVTPLFTSR